jgi:hypothetical protein
MSKANKNTTFTTPLLKQYNNLSMNKCQNTIQISMTYQQSNNTDPCSIECLLGDVVSEGSLEFLNWFMIIVNISIVQNEPEVLSYQITKVDDIIDHIDIYRNYKVALSLYKLIDIYSL